MRTKRSIKDSLKEYLNWCVGRLLLGGSRDDTVRDMVDAISDGIASGGGVVSQDQLDQTVQDITKSYGIADQTVLTSAESYTDQKIADVVDGSPEALDTLYELAKALGDDSNFATTVMDQIGQKLPTTTFENFIDNKAWTKDNLTKLSQLINNINSIKAGTRVESMDVNLASISSYLEYDLFDNNTTGTKPPGLTTGFLLTFSWDNGGWGAQIATSDGNVDGAIFLRTIKASESDKIWGPWVSLYNTANFNPDSKLNYNGFNGDLNTISTSGMYRLLSGCTNTPLGSSQGCFLLHTNWDANAAQQMYFAFSTTDIYIRNKVYGTWNPWQKVWNAGNFNPDNGGNADTVDNLHASSFTRADQSPNVDLNTVNGQGIMACGLNEFATAERHYPIQQAGTLFYGTAAYNSACQIYGTFQYNRWFVRGGGTSQTEKTAWAEIWTTVNFNPDDYLPKTTPTINSGTVIEGLSNVGNLPFLRFHIPDVNYSQFVMDENGTVHLLNGSEQTPGTYKPLKAGPIFSNGNRVWDAGNLGNATTSKAGLMSAADKTKLDGLSGGGLNIPAYIFPEDPSKLDSSASSTHITSILGTAIDLLDAFNNGRVFISKTVTFNEVQVPSDITYSLLKSIDPDNPTIFQIIMSTVVWGHYIEITIDFENNEYQAISNTINGIIGVNNTGTTN